MKTTKKLADNFKRFLATVGSKLASVFQFAGTHICPGSRSLVRKVDSPKGH